VSLIGVDREGAVCILTLQREEKLNALSGALERELLDAISGENVRDSRALVLTGAGKAFSAGADINEFADSDAASIAAYYADTGDVYERLAALPMPTIAAIHGWCLGGGLEMALATDFRIADETAAFGLPEVEIGILPSSGGTYRLVRLEGGAAQTLHHSPTSQYGQLSRIGRYDHLDVTATMRELVDDITSGRFADEWDAERDAGYPKLEEMRSKAAGDRAPHNKLYRPEKDGVATTIAAFVAAAVGLAPLGACGVKGPLRPPPPAAASTSTPGAQPAASTEIPAPSTEAPAPSPGSPAVSPPKTPETRP